MGVKFLVFFDQPLYSCENLLGNGGFRLAAQHRQNRDAYALVAWSFVRRPVFSNFSLVIQLRRGSKAISTIS
jgi:hypothetical protein